MLGPQLATERVNGKDKPLVEILANQLACQLNRRDQIYNPDYLVRVGQQYQLIHDKNSLQMQARSFYRERHAHRDCAIISTLAALPFHLVIYSAFDEYLYRAIKECDRECYIEWYNSSGNEKSTVQMGTRENPLIYYLYGSIREPTSLVLSESSLLDFLVAVISETPALPRNILSEFSDKRKCFLFLGFGFENWYLRILLHTLQGANKANNSFALEQLEPVGRQMSRETVIFFKQGFRINIFEQNLTGFVQELQKKYLEYTQDNQERYAADLSNSPLVFLCHNHNDRCRAAGLSRELKQRGLRPWLDRDNIYGGDSWDDVLENTINEEINYFVVLQSQAMEGKVKQYFFKEINLALEQQKRYNPDINFIIPVKIEECCPLENIRHLHTIDLTFPEGIDELVRAIKRDWQKRNR